MFSNGHNIDLLNFFLFKKQKFSKFRQCAFSSIFIRFFFLKVWFKIDSLKNNLRNWSKNLLHLSLALDHVSKKISFLNFLKGHLSFLCVWGWDKNVEIWNVCFYENKILEFLRNIWVQKSDWPPGILNTLKNVQFLVLYITKYYKLWLCLYTCTFFEDASPGNNCWTNHWLDSKFFPYL